MVWCAFCDVHRKEMLRTGKVDNRGWGQLLISVEPDAQDPAHEVGVEVVSQADGHACPLVEREEKNIRRRPPALVNQKVARYSAVLWYCIGLPAKGEDRQEEVQACPFKGVVNLCRILRFRFSSIAEPKPNGLA